MKKDNAKNKVDDFDEIFESPKFKSNEILDEAMEEKKKGNLSKAK